MAEDDLEIEDGRVQVKRADDVDAAGNRCGAVEPAALRLRRRQGCDAVRRTFDPDKPPVAEDEDRGSRPDFYSPTQATFANGMHAAIVETDPVTAEIRILRYCVIHDCGTMINPMIVEGQVHGGVAQGVGGALYERMVYDESGQAPQRLVHGLPHAVRLRGAPRGGRPPRDALAAEPAGDQGRGRGG